MLNKSAPKISVIYEQPCRLGEGAFWHPIREQFFWFDIINKKLFTLDNGLSKSWQFDQHVSASAWIDEVTLLIASETHLFSFDIETNDRVDICELEANKDANRSNDGRADPWGGFWIGTMGKKAEHEQGAIYRFYNGQLVQLHHGISIPNSICFSPNEPLVYFSDTKQHIIFCQKLSDEDGWPEGDAEILVDLGPDMLNPDGAVVDATGNIWCALWGASQIACISKSGEIIYKLDVPPVQPTCPAFGGDGLLSMFLTSASEGLDNFAKADGQVFEISLGVAGVAEYQVRLG